MAPIFHDENIHTTIAPNRLTWRCSSRYNWIYNSYMGYIYLYLYLYLYVYIYMCIYIYINNPNCTPHWLPPFSPGSPGWWLDIRLLMAHLLRRMLGTRTIKQPMVSNLGMATMGICIRKGTYTHMVPSQNCVWNVPRCSGRMERRGFVTGLVPDLWSVMKYRLYINK